MIAPSLARNSPISDEARPCASFISTKPLSTDPKPHLRRQVVLWGSLAGHVQKLATREAGDVVDPCRACDRRDSGAGPVSGKKISTLSSKAAAPAHVQAAAP